MGQLRSIRVAFAAMPLFAGVGLSLLFLLSPLTVSAQTEASKTPATAAKPELAFIPKREGKEPSDFLFQLGESITVKATGATATKIRAELPKGAGAKALTLYLDAVRMANLPLGVSEAEPGGDLLVRIHLARDPSNDENRSAWDTLLKKQESYVFAPIVSLAIGNDPAQPVSSALPFQFHVIRSGTVAWFVIVGLAILLVSYFFLIRSPSILRDSNNGPYSLGKSQMAFWGVLVILTFVGVWLITGTMERIPTQVLILLGISGATGLTAVVIGENKKAAKKSEISKREREQKTLEDEKKANPSGFSSANETRLKQINTDLQTLSTQLAPTSNGFWRDISSDENGLSFHRLQVVAWTIVLGAIFVRAVTEVISMPEFSETLLILLGISSGTYIGFKIPEKS